MNSKKTHISHASWSIPASPDSVTQPEMLWLDIKFHMLPPPKKACGMCFLCSSTQPDQEGEKKKEKKIYQNLSSNGFLTKKKTILIFRREIL